MLAAHDMLLLMMQFLLTEGGFLDFDDQWRLLWQFLPVPMVLAVFSIVVEVWASNLSDKPCNMQCRRCTGCGLEFFLAFVLHPVLRAPDEISISCKHSPL